jgi:hypothetical protein
LVAATTRTSVPRIAASDPVELPRLEHPQQLHLELDGHLGDLVEEERAARRLLEEALGGDGRRR